MLKIALTKQDAEIIVHSFGSYPAHSDLIERCMTSEDINKTQNFFLNYDGSSEIEFSRETWTNIHNNLIATIHVHGQEELSAITGFNLAEWMTTARKIFTALHGLYYGEDFQ